MAFFNLRPFGEDLADIRAGIVASTVANAMTINGRFRPSDFIPQYADTHDKTDDDLLNAAVKVNAMLGGTVRK